MEPAAARLIGAGLAAIGTGAAAIGVGIIFGQFLLGALRNPTASDGQFGRVFIGVALAEGLGIFALLTFGLTAVPSIICGHLALARTRSKESGSLGKSVALAGLVIGYASAALLGTWIVVLSRHLFQ